MGRSDQRDYARYHEVLNRAVWSSRQAARILLVLLLQHLDGGDGPLIFGIDEWNGVAAPRSGSGPSTATRCVPAGLRWSPAACAGSPIDVAGPRAMGRTPLGLAGLTVLAPSTRYYQQQGRQHKKLTDWARQMVMQLRRWLPHRPLVWWATTAMPCWICSTAASPSVNPLP